MDVADPRHAKWLGDGWYDVDDGDHRWMGQRAGLRLHGPDVPGMRLLLSGYCHKSLLNQGPAKLTLRVNGQVAGTFLLRQGGQAFSLAAPLPDHLVGLREIEVSLDLDRTFRIPDDHRQFGLSFGTFELK